MIGTGLVEAGVLVHMLEYLVLLEAGACDEEGILEIDLILLVVRLVCELNKAVNRELSLLGGVVCHFSTPNLVGLAVGNVVSHLRLDVSILS